MLKLNKLKYGLFTESQMQGLPVLQFDIVDDGQPLEKNENGDPTEDAKVKCCTELLEQVKVEIEKQHLEGEWVDFLIAKTYGVFTGDEMASPANVDTSTTLFVMLSHISHDIQNDLEGVEFRKRPPMFVFYGTPKYDTGTKQFYENFNVVFCNVDPNSMPNNMFALIEMLNHTFCTMQAVVHNVDDVSNFCKNYIDNKNINPDSNRAIVLFDTYRNEEKNNILKRCVEIKVRCVSPLYNEMYGLPVIEPVLDVELK